MNDEVRGAKPAQPLVATALDFTRRRGAICRAADLFLQRSGPYGSIWVCLDRAADGSAPVQRGLPGPFESLWESFARSRRLMWIRWIDTINPRAPVAALMRRFDQHFELTTPRMLVSVHDAVDRPVSAVPFTSAYPRAAISFLRDGCLLRSQMCAQGCSIVYGVVGAFPYRVGPVSIYSGSNRVLGTHVDRPNPIVAQRADYWAPHVNDLHSVLKYMLLQREVEIASPVIEIETDYRRVI